MGIPGSVGGAVRMNAGGHGRETAEVLVRARVVDLAGTGVEVVRGPLQLEFGYRRAALGPAEIVTGAEFVVVAAPAERCERDHQPRSCAGAVSTSPAGPMPGSVFRNPPGDSAGRIIDAAGLKGLRVGGAVVSPKHANFFQAEPGATADDVYRLVQEVRRRVGESSGIMLEPELRMVGFEDGP